MKRYYFFATLALFAMVVMGCTREKPTGPDSAPPQNVTALNTPAPVATASALVIPTIGSTGPNLAPATGITSTTAITVPDTSAAPASPTASTLASTSVTPTLALPPGIFSQPPSLNPTTSAPSFTAAATATPNSSASTLTGPTTYTVQWGDWLSKIARQFGVTNESIIAANQKMNPNFLVPGQVLNIPGPGGTNPTPSGATPTTTPGGGPTSYTVQRGDWFYAIARKFGVTFEALLAANPGVNPNIVFPGQVLNIPGSGPPPPPSATNTPSTGGATPTAGASATPGSKPSHYTVQAGDTLYSIAIRFNTTIYALQIANHLASPHFIYPGQVLVIPK